MPRGKPFLLEERREMSANGTVSTRLNDVERFVRGWAYRFANGDPMLAEDLMQEARVAVSDRLQEDPECPESHLMVKIKEAIYKYRRRGSSVDGKLNPNGRDRHYYTFSLQEPISDENDLKEEIVGGSRQGKRPTETQAVTSALIAQLRESLSTDEDRVFALRLTETSWGEIGEILDQAERDVYQIRIRIERKALTIWERPEPVYYTSYCRKPKRVAESRDPDLPEKIPAALWDVLTGQEREALEAYRQGATQEEAAKKAGISQPTVSRLIAFVWENHDKPTEELSPRTTRYKNDNRREQVLALFYSRPVGELVTFEELLELFADVKAPRPTMWRTILRYSRQLEGAEITLVRGEGYKLVEETKKSKLRDSAISELASPGAHAP